MPVTPATDPVLLVFHRDGLECLDLQPGEAVVVGRGPPSDLQPRSRRLSRRHARFERRPDGIWVDDLQSTNGTFLNGERVGHAVRLGANDEVTLGSVAVSAHNSLRKSTLTVISFDRFQARAERDLVQRQVVSGTTMLALARGAWLPNRWVGPLRDVLPSDALLGLYADRILAILVPVDDADAAASLVSALAEVAPPGARVAVGGALAPTDGRSLEMLIRSAWRALPGPNDPPGARLASAAPPTPDDTPWVHDSPVMATLVEEAFRVAPSSLPVLVTGEMATGRRTLAQQLHAESGRSGPFVVLAGASTSRRIDEEDLIAALRAAAQGTLFLEEVGDLNPRGQALLVRVIETGTWTEAGAATDHATDARVIARTTHDLESLCREGRFRWDLLFRLTAWVAEVPPLRARREDVRTIALQLVRSAADRQRRTVDGLTAEAVALLEAWSWPDNLVELRNVIERAVATARGPVLTAEELPGRIRVPVDASRQRVARTEAEDSAADDRTRFDLRARVESFENAVIRTALEANAGDADRAASLLRVRPEVLRRVQGDASAAPASDPSPPSSDVLDDFRQRVDRYEKRIIQEALVRCRGNLAETSVLLGVQRRTLSQKVARFGLARFVAARKDEGSGG